MGVDRGGVVGWVVVECGEVVGVGVEGWVVVGWVGVGVVGWVVVG